MVYRETIGNTDYCRYVLLALVIEITTLKEIMQVYMF